MRKRLFIALILILMLVPMSVAADNEKPLRFETTYSFVGYLGIQEEEYGDRTLTWQGEVFEKGNPDAVGTIQWWMFLGPDLPEPPDVTHFEDAIWVITLGEKEIMGYEWGSTTWIPGFERANWRANGRVIAASEGYEYLIDRPIHDGGFVDLTTWTGVGNIHINK